MVAVTLLLNKARNYCAIIKENFKCLRKYVCVLTLKEIYFYFCIVAVQKRSHFRQDEKWGIQMNNNIMICGENPELQLFLQTCILHDEHLKCFWFQINETPTAQVVSLVESSAFADNFVLEATAHPNWAELQLLLLGPHPKIMLKLRGKMHNVAGSNW